MKKSRFNTQEVKGSEKRQEDAEEGWSDCALIEEVDEVKFLEEDHVSRNLLEFLWMVRKNEEIEREKPENWKESSVDVPNREEDEGNPDACDRGELQLAGFRWRNETKEVEGEVNVIHEVEEAYGHRLGFPTT